MTMLKSLVIPLTILFSAAAEAPAQADSNLPYTGECDAGAVVSHKARASWYGPGFNGRKTANGEIFNMNAMTAAHKTLKLGTRVLVTNLDNGLQAVLRVNDRGPYIKGRTLDVSKRAADVLDFRDEGTARIRLTLCS